MLKKGLSNILGLGASLALGFNLLFSSFLYSEQLRRNPKYSVEINEQNKTFSVSPQVKDERGARDNLALRLVEIEEEKLKEGNKKLEEKIKDFFWENPTPLPILVKENPSTLQFEVEENINFQVPFVKYSVVKKKDRFEFKFQLENQNYFFQWDKSCGIALVCPKGSRVYRKFFDNVYFLNQQNADKFGNFKMIIDNKTDLREVGEFAVDILIKKHKKDILAMPEAIPVYLLYQAVSKLQEMEKEKIEGMANLRRGNIYVSKFTPATYFPTENEVGRNLFLGFSGKPERIEVFINGFLKENPLKKQYSGTDIRKDTLRFVKHYSIYPLENFTNSNENIVNLLLGMSKGYDEVLKEFSKKKFESFHEKDIAYDAFSLRTNAIGPAIKFLDENKSNDISDISKMVGEIHNRVQENLVGRKSLRERLDEYKWENGNVGSEIPEEIFQYYFNKNVNKPTKDSFEIQRVDLNFDNIPEILLRINNKQYAPAKFFEYRMVWRKTDKGWEEILNTAGFDFKILNDVKNGYKVIEHHDKWGNNMHILRNEFNGKKYEMKTDYVYDINTGKILKRGD